MTPFNITIEITEATQCHHAVSQLLRVFPKLRLTITVQDETIPTPAGTPQACHASDRCGHCYECAALCRAIDAIRYIGSAYRAGPIGSGVASQASVGTNEAGQAAQWSKVSADVDARNEAIDDADAIDRGDNHPDANAS